MGGSEDLNKPVPDSKEIEKEEQFCPRRMNPRAFLCCGAAVSEAEDAGAAQLIRQLRELPVRY